MMDTQIIYSGLEADELNMPSLQSTAAESVKSPRGATLKIKGFPEFQAGRSESWSFSIDPWPVKSDKYTFLVLSGMSFTKAETSENTLCLLSVNYEVQGWWSTDSSGRSHLVFTTDLLLKNSAGGVIWPVQKLQEMIWCNTRSGYKTYSYNLPLEYYDLINGVTLMQGQSWWYKC